MDIKTAVKIKSFEQDANAIRAVAVDGATFEGDALVGADGLHSAIRAQIINDGPPRVSGHTTFRSVIPTELMPEEFQWNSMTIWGRPEDPCRALSAEGRESLQPGRDRA